MEITPTEANTDLNSLTWANLGFNRNKTQTAATNICLNCITFVNLTFRMLQHTSSEVIIIQLQINLNSKKTTVRTGN